MSLERAYKNCQECYDYHSTSKVIIENKSIKRVLNGVSTSEIIISVSTLFMSNYLRNEAMSALEDERRFSDRGSNDSCNAEKLLDLCKECNYTTPSIKNFIDKLTKEK